MGIIKNLVIRFLVIFKFWLLCCYFCTQNYLSEKFKKCRWVGLSVAFIRYRLSLVLPCSRVDHATNELFFPHNDPDHKLNTWSQLASTKVDSP